MARLWLRWWPWLYGALVVVNALLAFTPESTGVRQVSVCSVCLLSLVWFRNWRCASQLAQRCIRRHGPLADSRCVSCRHYSCDGELCSMCEGPCTPVLSLPRLREPRPRADWLN